MSSCATAPATSKPNWSRCSRTSSSRCARPSAPSKIAPPSKSYPKKPNAASCAGADVGDTNAQPHIVRHVAAGDQVRLKSMNKVAIVQREVEKDLFEVALGPIKMRVKRDDIAEVVLLTGDSRSSTEASPLAAARQQKNEIGTA